MSKASIETDFRDYGLTYPLCKAKQTNADRIRSMSDEELADFIEMKQFFALANNGTDGEEYTLKWLQSEAEEYHGNEK